MPNGVCSLEIKLFTFGPCPLRRNMSAVLQEVTYDNPTGVKTPRITAVQLQCRIRPQGLVNPIAPGTQLAAIDFEGATAWLTWNQHPVAERNGGTGGTSVVQNVGSLWHSSGQMASWKTR